MSGCPAAGRLLRLIALLLLGLTAPVGALVGQGVTTGALNGFVLDADALPIAGAVVTAVHVPSGTPTRRSAAKAAPSRSRT